MKKISETKSDILRKLRRTTETFQKSEIGTLTLGLLFSFLMSNSQLQTLLLEGFCPSSLLRTCLKIWRFFEQNNIQTSLTTTIILQTFTVTSSTGRAMGAQLGDRNAAPTGTSSHGFHEPCRAQHKLSLPWTWQVMDGADSDSREEMEKAQCMQ